MNSDGISIPDIVDMDFDQPGHKIINYAPFKSMTYTLNGYLKMSSMSIYIYIYIKRMYTYLFKFCLYHGNNLSASYNEHMVFY